MARLVHIIAWLLTVILSVPTLRYLWKIESSSPSRVMKNFIERGCSAAAACCILSCWDCLVFKVWLILILLVWSHETIFVDSALLFVKPLAAQVLSCFFIGYQLYVLCPWETLELEILSDPSVVDFFHQKLPGTSRTVERRSWAMQAIAFPSTFTGADGLERWETCWEILLVWLVLQYSLKLHASGTFCRWDSIVIKLFDTSFQNRGDFSLKKMGRSTTRPCHWCVTCKGLGKWCQRSDFGALGLPWCLRWGDVFEYSVPQGVGLKGWRKKWRVADELAGDWISDPMHSMENEWNLQPCSPKIQVHQKHGSKLQWIFPSTPTKSFTIHHPTQKKILAHIKYTHFFTKSLRFAHLFWSKTSLSYLGEPWNFRASTDSRCFGRPLAAFNFLVVRSLRFTPVKMLPASVSLESLLGWKKTSDIRNLRLKIAPSYLRVEDVPRLDGWNFSNHDLSKFCNLEPNRLWSSKTLGWL